MTQFMKRSDQNDILIKLCLLRYLVYYIKKNGEISKKLLYLEALQNSENLMMFNNRTNNSSKESNSRSKSIGSRIFSYTGMRFFEPKFMDSLNSKHLVLPKTCSKASIVSVKAEGKVSKLPRV